IYRDLKAKMNVIDFDDQIMKVRALLVMAEARDWVRYKLDGGVDHILLDEAQDTAAAQWDIIKALSDEFFQPSPDRDPRIPRTLFAVGDEKQSIYSFQGAEPELFLTELQALTERQTETPNVKMSMSFRSTTKILQLVDQVFYQDAGILRTFDHDEDVVASDLGKHTAYRQDAGLIELWPAVPTPTNDIEENPTDTAPVDAAGLDSAREQLAQAVAGQIRDWLNQKEPVCVREGKDLVSRPMRPGDIMVLVKKRLGFFDALIRNLKQMGVPVAGADRLNLGASIAVQDLLSLAKFVLNPNDDLSLAEVLKSPIIGWDDQRLFETAYIGEGGRQGSLWQALPKGECRTLLNTFKLYASTHAPFEFFARVLATVPPGHTKSIKQRFLDRLGGEILDVLDVFLSRALAHQRRGAPSLMRFVRDTLVREDIIKRDMGSTQNEVRVMTVHAAKGLEAPVVILPDTTQVPSAGRELLIPFQGGGFIVNVSKNDRPEILQTAIELREKKFAQEEMRLLYVALTRAESRLLVCGFESNHKVAENSWYQWVKTALEGVGAKPMDTVFGEGMQYGERPKSCHQDVAAKPSEMVDLPSWTQQSAPTGGAHHYQVNPSRLITPDEDKTDLLTPVRSPLGDKGWGVKRYLRGNIIHKLLEILPDHPSQNRADIAKAFLLRQPLDDAQRREIFDNVFGVLDMPGFAHLFSKAAKAEVSLVGTLQTESGVLKLSGQIDRLWVGDAEVIIVDYKSNRPPAKTLDDVSLVYIRQMAAYRALLGQIYPQHKIKAGLLWTDGPTLMMLPDDLLDTVQFEAFTLEGASSA
ncbi:MAG TPA: double-strand break repair helicase AddA, partial [Hellea balneolensis]|nr:double-strand break repair helicase AddA [Hellea balneolensis]